MVEHMISDLHPKIHNFSLAPMCLCETEISQGWITTDNLLQHGTQVGTVILIHLGIRHRKTRVRKIRNNEAHPDRVWELLVKHLYHSTIRLTRPIHEKDTTYATKQVLHTRKVRAIIFWCLFMPKAQKTERK